MRRLLLVIFSITFSFLYADNRLPMEDYSPLKGVHRINVVVDWTSITIDLLTPEEWIEKRQKEKPRYDATIELEKQLKPQLFSNGLPKANEQLEKNNLKFVRHQNTAVELNIIPLRIDNSGVWQCDFQLMYSETKEIFAQFRLEGKNTSWGDLQTKWEYIFNDFGVSLGKFIKQKLKVVYKK